MEKAGTKTRDIKFFSPKNNAMMEFSRRYWMATGVTDWRVYVYGGEGKLVETHDQWLC